MDQGTLWDGQHVSCCDTTLQADLGCKLVQAYALHHDGRPACCGEQGLLQQGPGHFVEMGSMCPAVGLHCRQTWAAYLFKLVHCIMMADQHGPVVRGGCCSMEQGTLWRWAACTECCCQGKCPDAVVRAKCLDSVKHQ